MGRIVVLNHVSLDGVMQSPGRPDEDTSDGFTHGGWAISDEAAGAVWGERMAAGGGLAGWLLGRRTYEDVLDHWTRQPDSPFGEALVGTTKYVASTSIPPQAPPWPNTTVLDGDLVTAVADLKRTVDGVLAIMGSGQLIDALLPHGLVDELLLMVNPLVIGSGRRLFPEGSAFTRFRCTDARLLPSGLLVATYEQPDGARA
jgi:dihydrofolate reductase